MERVERGMKGRLNKTKNGLLQKKKVETVNEKSGPTAPLNKHIA